MTLFERIDSSGNRWYWVEGENDTAAFYPVPELTKYYTTEMAAMHRDFNQRIWTSIWTNTKL